jgi:hypothetical protein
MVVVGRGIPHQRLQYKCYWGIVDVIAHMSVAKLVPTQRTTGGCDKLNRVDAHSSDALKGHLGG